MFEGSGVKCNESALTGEPDDLRKDFLVDPFFLSSCEITDTGTSADAKLLCIGIGANSQWGKIKANLSGEVTNTPLQDKLDEMVELIGKGGFGSALATFIALVVMIWVKHDGEEVAHHVIEAFIIAVTIVVVAIPEGLPLAVTISLAYSTMKMLDDKNLIRQLQACETMGNATNICTDKTGTLTENRMTVVEAWFGGKHVDQDSFDKYAPDSTTKSNISLNAAINSTAFLQHKDEKGNLIVDGDNNPRPKVVGSATEGALILMLRSKNWSTDYQAVRDLNFNGSRDMQFPFNSTKKRSTVIICDYENSVRLICKGASEVILADCTHFVDVDGEEKELTDDKRKEVMDLINQMAGRALRTLALAHRSWGNVNDLPSDYKINPPDSEKLVLDSVVGIIDPLRGDVKEAVRTAQGAGVMVRMVTGDNIITACAIATQCGILTGKGEMLSKERYESIKGTPELDEILPKCMAIEGPAFRNLTPKQADMLLERVQVMARSSPDDKYLMVTRLNGHGMPKNQKEWEDLHPGKNYEQEKDMLLPGYKSEWESNRPNGGHVVGVTGDGTNDAPALKASDVGLSMGITGTQVAKNASDIVILDDKFSSIVKAIMWGRSVYDNIRKFLQFQLTVNVVALLLVFIGSVAGFPPPLNAVMMLWVNLIMDTLGALALGTEAPTMELLDRKPYLRDAPLVSWPMWRNILCQSFYQLIMLNILLFVGADMFDVQDGNWCAKWELDEDALTGQITNPTAGIKSCSNFTAVCGDIGSGDCYDEHFASIDKFDKDCLTCKGADYTHFSIMFNAFVFCQIFNEFNARSIASDLNCFAGIQKSKMFGFVIVLTLLLQVFIIGVGGEFTRTVMLDMEQWWKSIALGLISFPVGVLMRLIPMEEDPKTFFGYDMPE